MQPISSALQLLRESRRAFIGMNLLYGGLIVGGMVYSQFDPAPREGLWREINTSLMGSPLAILRDDTLPSVVIPFSGILVGVTRALVWGLLAPNLFQMSWAGLISGLCFVGLVALEGESYVVTMLASFLQGKAVVVPASAQAKSRWRGFCIGIQQTAQLYTLIAPLLIIAASYETLLSEAVQSGFLAPVR